MRESILHLERNFVDTLLIHSADTNHFFVDGCPSISLAEVKDEQIVFRCHL